MAILSIEIDLEMLDKALGSKGLVADLNDPEKKIVLAAEGSNVTDAQIVEMANSLESQIIAKRAEEALKEQSAAAAKADLLARLGITAEEAKILLT